MTIELHLGDCLEVMRSMPDNSAVITDLFYSITARSWDVIIPYTPIYFELVLEEIAGLL